MFVVPTAATPLAAAIVAFFWLLRMMLFVRIILSWFPIGRNNKFMQILFAFTEPVLAPIRNLVNRSPLGGSGMVLDFSPIIAFILLGIVERAILGFIS